MYRSINSVIFFTGLLVFLLLSVPCFAGPDKETAKLINDLQLRKSAKPLKQNKSWKKPKVIVVTMMKRQLKSRPDAIKWLQKVAGGARIIETNSRSVEPELLKDADVLLGYCNHHNLKHGPKLRYILNYSAGVDHCIKTDLSKRKGLVVTNSKRILGPPIAEHVIGMMYSHTRKLYVYHQRQLEKKWDRKATKRDKLWEVQGRTMLVVGLGGIGTEVAKRANGLGMTVIGLRNSSRKGPKYVSYVGLSNELHKLAGKADVVVNTVPLTPKTKYMFDAKFFKSMKRDAYFINVGRGQSVVSKDLVEALNKGIIGGAALDVQDPEPLPPDNPLWTAKNITITPHISSGSERRMSRFWLLVRENLRRYVNGEKMLNEVNIKRGY
jgi:phosphoglycerate dehydrogenase-like enzyme